MAEATLCEQTALHGSLAASTALLGALLSVRAVRPVAGNPECIGNTCLKPFRGLHLKAMG